MGPEMTWQPQREVETVAKGSIAWLARGAALAARAGSRQRRLRSGKMHSHRRPRPKNGTPSSRTNGYASHPRRLGPARSGRERV